MSIRKAVYDLLNNTEADVYALVAPQELTDPFATYGLRITDVRSQSMDTQEVILTLNIYANTWPACITLADALYTALEKTSGTFDSETLIVCNRISEGDGYIPELDKYNIMQEYQLRFI